MAFTYEMLMEFDIRHKQCGMNAETLARAAGVVTNVDKVCKHLNQVSFHSDVAFEFQQMFDYTKQIQAWTFNMDAHINKIIESLRLAAVSEYGPTRNYTEEVPAKRRKIAA